MEKNISLAVMAAGMGSRFGGLKQMEPIGPSGEVLLDYSVYDAKKAGFNKVVFIIKKAIEHDFREQVGKRIEKSIDVSYVFQELDANLNGFEIPEGRVKPWGTGHAILCAKDAIDNPFAVINADDYYGKKAYVNIAENLKNNSDETCMVAFKLENTLTENGHVARGVCETDENGFLKSIVERTKIKDLKYTEDDVNWIPLPKGTIVSMNMWGFPTRIFDELESGFKVFLNNLKNPVKDEYFLPSVVDIMIKQNGEKVRVLSTDEKWYGVTYKEDKQMVVDAISKLTKDGFYNGI